MRAQYGREAGDAGADHGFLAVVAERGAGGFDRILAIAAPRAQRAPMCLRAGRLARDRARRASRAHGTSVGAGDTARAVFARLELLYDAARA